MSKHLAGNTDNRSGVDHSICQTSYKICCTGPACCKYNTRSPAYSCKTLCRMNSPLFMTNQYMCEFIMIIIQCIIDRHDGTTGVAKDDVDTFSHKSTKNGFATTY